jgi:gliding motility-associated-like protein
MKYKFILILSLIGSQAFSQTGSLISVGSEEGMTITAGGILLADGLSITPTEDFTLSNTNLDRVSASTAKLLNQVSRVYQFSNPSTSFSGSLSMIYSDSELNGLSEQDLQLFIFNPSKWYRQATQTDATNNSLSSNISSISLSEITSAVFMPNLILTASSIAENSALGSKVIDLVGTDENVIGEQFTYSLVSGTGSTDNASFKITGSELQTNTALDFETKKAYSVRLRVTDAYGRFDEKSLSISITDVNETPSAMAITKSNLYESNTINQAVGALSTTDPDAGDSFTYSLVSGTGSTDNSIFRVSGNTLGAANVFDFETKSSYSIRIQTTDAAGLSFQKEFTVTIVNVNEAPTAIALSNATTDENNAIDASIGTLTTTDPDAADSFTYSLVSGAGSTDNSKFTLSGNTLKAAEAFDFETKSSYSIRIQTTDAAGLSFQKTLSISVNDVNDYPSAIVISVANLFEANVINQVIGQLSTTDQDAGDSHTYSLVSGQGSTDNFDFNISGNQLRAAKVFSFANKSSYSIRLRTTDKAGWSFDKAYSITISQLPTLTGTGNEFGTQAPTAASTSPKISKGYKSNLQVSGNNLVSYSWSPSKGLSSTSIANPVAEITETATYSVLVTNSFGSSVTLNITIEVMEDWNIVANNILTQNGDGINDNWVIDNLSSYPNNQLIIVDRSNVVIYKKTGYANDWDGLFNGATLPSGTYYYMLIFDSPSGQKVSKKGFITITK